MGYPVLYSAVFGRWVPFTGSPGRNAVPSAADYQSMFPDAPPDIQLPDHNGVDGSCPAYTDSDGTFYPVDQVPIYMLESGVVIEATNDIQAREGRYIWSETLGIAFAIHVDSIKNHKIVIAMGHFSDRKVSVGNRVVVGRPYATQGKTGYATGFHNHTKIFVDDKLIDATPYVVGLDGTANVRRLIEDYADPVVPVPDPEPSVIPLPVQAQFQYTDNDELTLRDGPAGEPIGNIVPGSMLYVDMIAFASGKYWAHIALGWCALGDATRFWVSQVVTPDQSALVAELTSKLDIAEKARDAASAAMSDAAKRFEVIRQHAQVIANTCG